MTIEHRSPAAALASIANDHLSETIARAIGVNDPYPTDVQRAVHRARQAHNERFMKLETVKLRE